MERGLMLLLIGNLIAAVLYAVIKAVRREGIGITALFLFLPVLGFVIYFLPRALSRLLGKERYDRDSLVRRNRIERMAEHPNIEEALNVVPVEDAMAVNENKEKRALLLRQLKKDINENYRALLAAEKDEDSESVHYVAATKMEVYRVLHQRWLESLRAYEADRTDHDACREACEALRRLIGSGVLSGREREMYQKKYCSLMENQVLVSEEALADIDYENWLACLIELKRFQEAEELWNRRRDRLRSENGYMKMTELFYHRKEKTKFGSCIAELQKDRQVKLSAQGLARLRYWMQRG